MDVLGEDLVNSLEKKSGNPKSDSNFSSRPLPSVPSPLSGEDSRGLTDSLDEPPPEIPQRTDARLELVDFQPVSTASVASPTYDIPGAITTSSIDGDEEMGGGGGRKNSSQLTVGYEQPTPCECIRNTGPSEDLIEITSLQRTCFKVPNPHFP